MAALKVVQSMLLQDSGTRRTREIGTVNDLLVVVDDISKSISRGFRISGTQKQVITQVASVIKVRDITPPVRE